jgi:peptide/nickel transport system substrate-binding protein
VQPGNAALLALTTIVWISSCARKPDSNTLVMIIESSPTNLDPRVGLDAQSEDIDGLLFDNLLARDEHLNVKAALAERWEIPDPKTYVFHLHDGVRFCNGAPLTARDVKWTFDSVLGGKLHTPKSSSYKLVDHVDAPDDLTVIFHLKEPWAGLLWNLAGGEGMGIVPDGSMNEMTRKPIGSGPFCFVAAEQDRYVDIRKNENYWGEKAKLQRVHFMVVPDATTRALELRKGSADLALELAPDTVLTLKREPHLQVLTGPGTRVQYMAFNLRDPILKDVRVRRAMAYALDTGPIIHFIWRDFARRADSVLPPESWAYNGDVQHYAHDPAKARELLDEAGYMERSGVRFHLQMKTSTEETSRAIAAVFQQQLRQVGIALDLRSYEPATFLSDVTHGEFQVYSLRWVGGNQDPEIFEYAFDSANIIPNGANRQYYSNPRVDALIGQARAELDQRARKRDYAELQNILAEDLPYVDLWYLNNVMVASKRVRGLEMNPAGNFDFLRTAELQ